MNGDEQAVDRDRVPRILMLGKGWFPEQLGGLDRMYRDLFEALPEAAAHGVVIGPAQDSPPGIHAVSRHDAPMMRRLVGYWRAVDRDAYACEVIDAHFALYAMPSTFAGRARHRPWVVHFQGPWAAEAQVQGDRSPWRYHVRRAVERRVYARADRILVLTSAFRQEVVTRYRLVPWNVVVVPPGVDLEGFSAGDRAQARASLDIEPGAFLAVCVRRLVPRMGIEALLDAWRLALDGGLPEGARLLIAGDGVSREALDARIQRLRLGGSVRLLGRVEEAHLLALYRAADVGVVPTLSQEGFGLIVIEAAACGTPSIVTSAGGLPEVVAGLDPTLVVPPDDPPALARRIRAAHDGRLPDRAAARSYAERFSWLEMAGRREVIYKDVAAGTADRRLRVVYLDHVGQLSGGELALLRLLSHLHDVNAHVILFEDGPFAERLNQACISVEIFPLAPEVGGIRKDDVAPGRLPFGVAWRTVAYTARLSWRLRQLRPDVVHTNSLKAGFIGSVAARLAGLPVVWHLRDRLADDYLPGPAVSLMRWWVRIFATRVIANSANTAETLHTTRWSFLRRFASIIPEVSVIPAPLEAIGPVKPTNGSRHFTVGMVGRLTPWKGQDIFLRAFAEAFPDGDERAVIAGSAMFGDAEEAYAAGLRTLTEELGIADRVEWRGFVDDVPGELAGFDVLVHASRVAEPFGQVVLEGLAAGVVVVAADDGGPREIIRTGYNGLLCPPGDVGAYAHALRELREDEALREVLVTRGRERAADFAPEIVTRQLMATYEAVLRDRGQSARTGGR